MGMAHQNIDNKISELTDEILRGGVKNLAIIGVRTGGEEIAKSVWQKIRDKTGKEVELGMVDITLYRDDLDNVGGLKQPLIRATEVPFSIDGKRLILVDDVLFTGRTIRAALDALCDLGRPAKIDLMVLVDRGFRELPIRPDFVGDYLETKKGDRVEVLFDDKKGWSIKVNHGD